MQQDSLELHLNHWKQDISVDSGLRKPKHLYSQIKQSY